jgi:hypothetical protein
MRPKRITDYGLGLMDHAGGEHEQEHEEEEEEEEEEEQEEEEEVRKQKPYRPPNLSRSMPLDAARCRR